MEDRISYAAITAVLVFGLSKIIEIVVFWWKNQKDKEKFIRSLFAEIDFNTTDMEEFIQNPISVSTVIEKIKSDKNFIPHITDARHTEIYKSNIKFINYAGNAYVADVIYFYGLLERIKGQIDGVYLPSYLIISGQGRANVINRIYNDSNICAFTGREILEEMRNSYPEYQLERKIRKAPIDLTDAQLVKIHAKLTLDLDRVGSTHKQTPL